MATAKQILPEPIDLLFLDADHTRDFAVFCVENVFPKLAKSHSIAIHDYGREEANYMLTQWYPQNQNCYCLLENLPQLVKDAVPNIEELLPLKQGDVNKPCWPSPSLWFFRNTLNCPS
jgi:hypothetical protein